jgi:hypothetical protein
LLGNGNSLAGERRIGSSFGVVNTAGTYSPFIIVFLNTGSYTLYKKLQRSTNMYEKARSSMETIIAISKVFQYGKTTIPKEVRLKLDVQDGDKILWLMDENDHIIISKRKGL